MKVSPAGQIVIPPPLQDESGIYPGTEIEVQHENGALVVRRREPDEHTREIHEKIEAIRALRRGNVRTSAKTLEEVAGLSRGEQFVQLLADAGVGHMMTDELMEMMRGPHEDLDPP